MPGNILTMASRIMCPHGGQAILTTSNSRLLVGGAPALLQTDAHAVAGCAFTLPGPKPSPCVTIRWSGGATRVTVGGVPVLVQSSVGICSSPEQAPQGPAIVVSTQVRVTA